MEFLTIPNPIKSLEIRRQAR